MVNKTDFNALGVFHKAEVSPNKPIGFKELLAEIRSALQGTERHCASGFGLELADKPQEIRADPAGQHPDSALPVSAEPPEGEVDPLELSLAPPIPPLVASAPQLWGGAAAASEGEPAPPPPFESALVESVVRRVVWGGDRRRGVARLELDGDYAGTTILVRGEGRALEVEITLGGGPESNALPDRLLERLRARGLDVARVAVR